MNKKMAQHSISFECRSLFLTLDTIVMKKKMYAKVQLRRSRITGIS